MTNTIPSRQFLLVCLFKGFFDKIKILAHVAKKKNCITKTLLLTPT